VCDGFEVETHMNVRAARARLKITEVPSCEHERLYGTSNLKPFRDGLRVLRTIFKEWLTRPTTTPKVYPRALEFLELRFHEEGIVREPVEIA
jgi:hypothetical protein